MKPALPDFLLNWSIRVVLGASTLIVLAWLLAPNIRGLLQSSTVMEMDRQVAAWLHAASSPSLIEFMRWISLFHGIAGVLCMTAIAAAALGWYGEWEVLPTLLASVPGGMLINVAVKFAVQRERPHWGYGLESLESFSFPSGHTEGATLFYGVMVVWLWPRIGTLWMRATLLVVVASLVLLVATSRIVLGLHFLSDCIAAVLEALLWLVVCLAAARSADRVAAPLRKNP